MLVQDYLLPKHLHGAPLMLLIQADLLLLLVPNHDASVAFGDIKVIE